MSDLLDGQISIKLGDEEAVLMPTLFAATRISRHFGGLQNCLQKMTTGDLDALTTVVRYGLGFKSEAEANGLDEKVWRAGVFSLTTPVTEYVLVLSNGGRPLNSPEPDAGKKTVEPENL